MNMGMVESVEQLCPSDLTDRRIDAQMKWCFLKQFLWATLQQERI